MRAFAPLCLLAVLACLLFAPPQGAFAADPGDPVNSLGQWCKDEFDFNCVEPCVQSGTRLSFEMRIWTFFKVGATVSQANERTSATNLNLHACKSSEDDRNYICCMVWTHCGDDKYWGSGCPGKTLLAQSKKLTKSCYQTAHTQGLGGRDRSCRNPVQGVDWSP